MAARESSGFKFFLIFLAIVLLAVVSYFYLTESAVEEVEELAPEAEEVVPDTSGGQGP